MPRARGVDIRVETSRNSRGLIEVSIGIFISKIDVSLLFTFYFLVFICIHRYILFCKIYHDFQNKREEIYLTFPINPPKFYSLPKYLPPKKRPNFYSSIFHCGLFLESFLSYRTIQWRSPKDAVAVLINVLITSYSGARLLTRVPPRPRHDWLFVSDTNKLFPGS